MVFRCNVLIIFYSSEKKSSLPHPKKAREGGGGGERVRLRGGIYAEKNHYETLTALI